METPRVRTPKVMCNNVAGTHIRQTNVKHFWVIEAYKTKSELCNAAIWYSPNPVHAEPSLSEMQMNLDSPEARTPPEPQLPSRNVLKREVYRGNARSMF